MTNHQVDFDESVVSQDELDKAMQDYNHSIVSNTNQVSFNSTKNLNNNHIQNMDYNTDAQGDLIQKYD